MALTFAVRVKPASRRPGVGGAWGEPAALVVAVAEPALEGRANDAVVRALATAFGVPRGSVTVLRGVSGRSKVVRVDGDAEALQARLAQFLTTNHGASRGG